MKSNSIEIIKGTSGYFLANIINAGFNFVFVVIATRLLGAGGYGLIALGVTVFGLSNNFGLFGFGLYSQKVLSGKFDQKKAEILGSMFFINIVIAIFVFLLLFFGSEFISINIFNKSEFAPVLKVIAFTVLFSLPVGLFRTVLKAQKKIKKNLLSVSMEGFLKLTFLVFALVFENYLLIVALSIFFASFASSFVTFWFLLKEKILPVFSNLKLNIKKTVFLSSQFLIVGMGYFLSSQTDRLMLGGMTSSEELGFYAIAASMAIVMNQIHASMVSIFMPMISEAYKKRRKNEIKETYFFSNVFSALASGAILISFSAFGAIVLSIFGVGNLEIIYFILLALSVRTFIGSLAGPTGALLNMADRHKLEIFNTIILMVLNILLNYFMIKEYGVLGAGLATLFGGIAAASIRSLEVCKIYEFFIYRKIHLFIFLVVSFFVVGGLLVNSYQKSLFFNIGFFIFGEAFLFSVVYNLLDQNQKAFLKEKVKHCFKLGMYLRNKPPF